MSCVQRSFVREILKVTEQPDVISFAGGLPNPRFFPVREIEECTRWVLETGGPAALQYATTEGFPPLRELVAAQYAQKGIPMDPGNVLILNGSQQGLDLLGKIFLDEGDAVLVERPTYLAAIQAFGMYRPAFRSVLLERDGVRIGDLAEALRPSPKFFYTVSNFQNPSGISYGMEKRRETARLIGAGATVLVEDDPYGALRFRGTALPPIASLFGASWTEHAALLGTFSKIVAPGLRLGWVCAGRQTMDRLVTAKQAADLHTSGLSQRIVHRYLTSCDVEGHIARIRAAYGRQRDVMVEMVRTAFPPDVSCTEPEGGMFLWMTLPEGVSALEMFEKAVAEKVAFVPGQAFFADGGGQNTLRLNFSNADEGQIREGMGRLARVFASMRGRS